VTLSRNFFCITSAVLLSASAYASTPEAGSVGNLSFSAGHKVSWNSVSVTGALAAVVSCVAYNDADEINRMMDMNIHRMYYGGAAALLVVGAALGSGQLYATAPASISNENSRSSFREALPLQQAHNPLESKVGFLQFLENGVFSSAGAGHFFDRQSESFKLGGFGSVDPYQYDSSGWGFRKNNERRQKDAHIAKARIAFISEMSGAVHAYQLAESKRELGAARSAVVTSVQQPQPTFADIERMVEERLAARRTESTRASGSVVSASSLGGASTSSARFSILDGQALTPDEVEYAKGLILAKRAEKRRQEQEAAAQRKAVRDFKSSVVALALANDSDSD
jgi:hypothetical protein